MNHDNGVQRAPRPKKAPVRRNRTRAKAPLWRLFLLLAGLVGSSQFAPRGWQRLEEAFSQPRLAISPAHTPAIMDHPASRDQAAAPLPIELPAATVSAATVSATTVFAPTVSAPTELMSQNDAPAPTDALPVVEPEFTSLPIRIEISEQAELPSLLAVSPELPRDLFASPRRSPFLFSSRQVSKPQATQPASESPLPPFALPTLLLKQLQVLSQTPQVEGWANDVRSALDDLSRLDAKQTDEINRAIDHLAALAVAADELKSADESAIWPLAVRNVKYGLARRIVLWKKLPLLSDPAAQPNELKANTAARLATAVTELETFLKKDPAGEGWRKYLRLDALSTAAEHPREIDATDSQQLLTQVLRRIEAYDQTAEQRQLMQNSPFVALREILKILTLNERDVTRADEALEKYESQHSVAAARQLASLTAALSDQPSEPLSELGHWLNEEYREANFRVAASTHLLNRMVSQERFTVTPVRDTILGADVRGRSQSATRLTITPVPDDQQIRLELEAHGRVSADTEASSGPATFYGENHSTFLVRKRVELTKDGLKTHPAEANANAYADQLNDLSTNFDGVPILGAIVQNAARNRHEESRFEARRITEGKVAHRARVEVEDEVQKKLVAAEKRLRSQLLDPLSKLGISPEPVELATTDSRLIARMRVADIDQLAADTPRPFAPSDSWLSLQVHESLINNFLQRLELSGKKMSLQEVYSQVADRLELKNVTPPEDLPDEVEIRFAEQPFRVKFDDNRVELVVSIADLKQGSNHWRDFFVTYCFRIEASGVQLRMMRDKAIQLGGDTLRGKPQIMLRTIFSKALPRDHEWPLFPEDFAKDKRLEDLTVSQLLLRDGWIATAWSQRADMHDIAARQNVKQAPKK